MSILFQPLSLGSMTVKNRFVRSATHDWMGNPDGSISDREIALYRELAKNEIGLIITAHSYVQHPLGKASLKQNAIYEDRFIASHSKLAATVQAAGAKIVMQISHAGRQSLPKFTEGLTPVAPSPVAQGKTGDPPRELAEEEIIRIIQDFIAAMERAKTAGYDGVQLHAAHGYLLSQFISPYTNRRTDRWGGSLENRTRILREIISGARARLGSEFPILVKLNSTDGITGPGYLALEDVVYTAKLMESLGVTAIEVSGGIQEIKGAMARNVATQEEEGYFLEAARAIKENVRIPVILVGGLRSFSIMENIVGNNLVDMVALCRPFIMEPDLVVRFRNGQGKASCISCNACFQSFDGLRCHKIK